MCVCVCVCVCGGGGCVCAKMYIPSFREACNLIKGTNFFCLTVEPPLPLLFLIFFAGSPITVTSCPFGRPRLCTIGGMLIPV